MNLCLELNLWNVYTSVPSILILQVEGSPVAALTPSLSAPESVQTLDAAYGQCVIRPGMNNANLLLRFLLELAAVAGFALWSWNLSTGYWRVVTSVAIVLALAAVWATFAVPNDPSRSGNAPVPVPGMLRLVLEFAILLGGALALRNAGYPAAGLMLAALVLLHYALSLERVFWLLRQ